MPNCMVSQCELGGHRWDAAPATETETSHWHRALHAISRNGKGTFH